MRAIQGRRWMLFEGFLLGRSGLFIAFLSFEITVRTERVGA